LSLFLQLTRTFITSQRLSSWKFCLFIGISVKQLPFNVIFFDFRWCYAFNFILFIHFDSFLRIAKKNLSHFLHFRRSRKDTIDLSLNFLAWQNWIHFLCERDKYLFRHNRSLTRRNSIYLIILINDICRFWFIFFFD